MSSDRLEVSVTFDPARGYVASAPELRAPVMALSLGSLRRRIEALMPARQRQRAAHARSQRERAHRRRAQAQLSRVLINRDCLAITE
jgi:hypothetical protein